METIHATCIALNGGGVLLTGPSGAGKSDLALRLIDAGANLVADDRVALRLDAGEIVASAPKALRGKLEVRGLGILSMVALDEAPVALVIALKSRDEIERYPSRFETRLLDVAVTYAEIDPFDISAAAKVRAMLTHDRIED